VVRTDAGAVIPIKSSGIQVPHTMVVLSHDRKFINSLLHYGNGYRRPNTLTSKEYLENMNKVEYYLRHGGFGESSKGPPSRAIDILKIGENDPYLWFPHIEKPQAPVSRARRRTYAPPCDKP
jgi:hypothetical protein